MVTAQQVAKKAGVSPTTVSFVMNDVKGANISEATRQKVLAVAEELGYVPHALAKSLAKGRSDNIGLFLIQPHDEVFADPYIPNIITGIRNATQSDGFRILVEQVRSENDAQTILTMLKSGEVAGAIITNNIWDAETLSELKEFPVVCLNPILTNEISYVAIDHDQGVKELAQHMSHLNRYPIGVIPYALLSAQKVQKRLDIFRELIESSGYAIDDANIIEGAYHPESGYYAMKELLIRNPKLQAVYCMNDMMAVGALAYLNEHGISAPDDIAIVGYDDIRVSGFLTPPLTTVRAPEVKLGQLAGDTLLELINNKAPTITQHLLPTQLVIRQSCGYKNL